MKFCFLFSEAATSSAQGEMSALAQRLEAVTRQLEDEKKQALALKKQLEVMQKADQEKSKLQKEVLRSTYSFVNVNMSVVLILILPSLY